MDAVAIFTAIWLVLSIVLALVSTATLGRKMADVEYLSLRGINSARSIRAWADVRTHANHVFAGVVFAVIAALALVEAPPEWRVWTARIAFIAVILAFCAGAVLDWIDDRRLLRLALGTDGDAQTSEEAAP